MVYESNSWEDTFNLGKRLGEAARAGQVYCLDGDLGVGKTVFTQGFAQGLGIEEPVGSPTFTIVNEYEGGRLPLFHFDLYRMDSPEELFDIGWEDYLARGGVCAVEWSEHAEGAFEEEPIWVDIRRGESDDQRIISIRNAPDLL